MRLSPLKITPSPAISLYSPSSVSRLVAEQIALAIGCEEVSSAVFAAERSSLSLKLFAVWILSILSEPSVTVPVLSNAAVSHTASRSTNLPPFMRMPFLDAAPIPAKKASGTEMTSAHGQAATRMDSALYSHSDRSPPRRTGTIATQTHSSITAGV